MYLTLRNELLNDSLGRGYLDMTGAGSATIAGGG